MKKLGVLGFAAGIAVAEDKYLEAYRPQFHFSQPRNWMNDPNGMVYNDGKYHLHYQYHPWGDTWGPMHWGHAESSDLIHWVHKEIAIFPDKFGTIFSGGGTVIHEGDEATMSGLDAGTSVLFYSQHCVYDKAHNDTATSKPLELNCLSIDPPPGDDAEIYVQHQSFATTIDHVTYTKHADNPVLVADLGKYTKNIRDPKVFFHVEGTSKHWYMILANQDRNRYFKSDDLKTWTEAGSFGGEGQFPTAGNAVWECPDLFTVPVEGETDPVWIQIVSVNPGGNPDTLGSGSFYFVGSFDDTEGTFKPDDRWSDKTTPAYWLDDGIDNYAGLVWNNSPTVQGVVFTGWMSNWKYGGEVPTTPWRSAMTVPRVITTVKHGGDVHLRTMPHAAIEKLRCDGAITKTDESIAADNESVVTPGWCDKWSQTYKGLVDLDLKVVAPTDKMKFTLEFTMDGANDVLKVSVDGDKVKLDRSECLGFKNEFWELPNSKLLERTRKVTGDTANLRVLLDRSSIEVFVDEGDLAITALFFTSRQTDQSAYIFDKVVVKNDADAAIVHTVRSTGLAGIWDHANMETPADPAKPSSGAVSRWMSLFVAGTALAIML